MRATAQQRTGVPQGTRILFARQRHLLLLLDALGGSTGNRDFQKLLFLYCEEPSSGRPYDFVPYMYGAFSFTSYADRRKLIARGLLDNDDHNWTLTDEARRVIGQTPDMHLAAFARRYSDLRGEALVADTYRRFPYYATRSEIAARVLRNEPEALERVKLAREIVNVPDVLTIGYEGHTLESYLNVLLGAGVRLLCDVRRNPLSRKFGFSKGTLLASCEAVGIRYEHLPELGIASEQRRGLESQLDYDSLFAHYERNSLPKQLESLSRIANWVRAGERTALTCYEHLPDQCHRHCVAEALQQRFGEGFLAKHL